MKTFKPQLLPLRNIAWIDFVESIAEANYYLASFEGALKAVVNPGILLSPLTAKEAVLSSKIEGTQATLQEVLAFAAEQTEESPKNNDIREVINYRKALGESEKLLQAKPMHLNMVKSLHSILLDSVRGESKSRGEFRKTQNWIGIPGSKVSEAFYIPPEPMLLNDYLSNWERYWHSKEKDKVVQLAIIHAQFELIHPFLDGNGRIGRMLIPLFLFEKGLLRQPVFYMSEYLETNRDEYYARLREISNKDDWNGWIKFFLKGFIIQAQANRDKAEKIISLYEKMKREIHDLNTTFALPALDTLFTMPIFNTLDFIKYSDIPRASAMRLIKQLSAKNHIQSLKKGRPRHPGIFMFKQLIDIVEGRDSSHR